MGVKITVFIFSVLFAINLLAQNQAPNILIIQTDDMGYDDLSVNGNLVSHTPNIDEFSQTAVRFDNFMLCSVCAPTRASLLTGRDFWRTGVSAMHGGNDYLHLDETTFAEIFQQNGYSTGMWGKWHSGKSDGYWPWDRGFDEAYYARLYNYLPSNGWFSEYPEKTTHQGRWSAEVLTDYTIDFIDRNKDGPFLAYLSYLTCHDKWKAPEEFISKYRIAGRTERFATLLGMLEYMDLQVGRLLQFLTENNLDENTVVIFLSDNGPNLGDTNAEEWALRNNHGFLGNKARLWQNGLKSPLYIRWKGTYQNADVERLVSITDIFPTLLDIAGISVPENNLPLDGRSFKPYLRGDTESLSEKQAFFSHWFPIWGQGQWSPIQPEEKAAFDFNQQRITIINERYKLLHNPVNVNGSPEKVNDKVLIDLKADPLERTNVAAENPNIVNSMMEDLENWFTAIKNESNSFTPPVFQIAWKGKNSSEIRAYGPSKTVGCINDSHELTGLDKKGDYAEYKVNVHRTGIYKISISTSGMNMEGLTLNVSCNNAKVQSALQNKSFQKIGAIPLEAGQHTLKIEISEITNGSAPEIKEFRGIQLDLETKSLGLSDSLATKETLLLFENLKKIGKKGVIFGQHLACYEAQNWKDNAISVDLRSDCFTAVGDHPGVFGFDFGRGITLFKDYCEEIFRRGGISTYSWHARNPVTGGNYNDTSGEAVSAILEGGEIYQKWISELDKIADYLLSLEVNGVKVPIIFRPFHENTGAWFWWGAGNCTNNEFIELWQLTIDYLRNERGVHNMLVAYSPSKPSLNKALAEAMYPGNNYVDIIGFDAYDKDEKLKTLLRDNARLVSIWAQENNKVPAITEFGIRQGLQNSNSSDFFMNGFLNQFKNDEIGKNVAFALTWMNTSPESYWTPLPGQPNHNSFLNFYHDSTTLFLGDVKNIYDEELIIGEDTTAADEVKKGFLKLKTKNRNWYWVGQNDTIISMLGYYAEKGNISLDTSMSEYLTFFSVYASQSIIKTGGPNGSNISDFAWIGTGNSNPVLRIIYKTDERVQAILSSEIEFDGSETELNTSVVFNPSQTWDTLTITLHTLQKYKSSARHLVVNFLKLLYPSSTSNRLSLKIKEIAYGAIELIAENDISTNYRMIANPVSEPLCIYPNPTYKSVTINLPDNNFESVKLFNSAGECIEELYLLPDTSKVKIHLENYTPGLYLVRAEQKKYKFYGVFLKI